MSKNAKGWIWGAAIGAVVGSVTALLFAPKPGRELRKDIADGARQVGEKTQQVAEKVSEQSAELASRVKETAGGLVSEFQAWRAAKEKEDNEDTEVRVSSLGENEAPEETAVIGVAGDNDHPESDVSSEQITAAGETEQKA
ncbi:MULTISPECIES: YtxH domain-containing protein [Paenibacillus]|uniref:YtxH domain-containing protein n=1 Tax=Paenibacillus TaxID=44249 RepID=UPI002FE03D6C